MPPATAPTFICDPVLVADAALVVLPGEDVPEVFEDTSACETAFPPPPDAGLAKITGVAIVPVWVLAALKV